MFRDFKLFSLLCKQPRIEELPIESPKPDGYEVSLQNSDHFVAADDFETTSQLTVVNVPFFGEESDDEKALTDPLSSPRSSG